MARPRKWRKVCCLPETNLFGPLGSEFGRKAAAAIISPVIMNVDEYETIRLIDLEGMNQEECAEKMHIARTTVQGMYATARQKLADALVNGKPLSIEGGDYRLCDGGGPKCGHGGCRRHLHQRKPDQTIQDHYSDINNINSGE